MSAPSVTSTSCCLCFSPSLSVTSQLSFQATAATASTFVSSTLPALTVPSSPSRRVVRTSSENQQQQNFLPSIFSSALLTSAATLSTSSSTTQTSLSSSTGSLPLIRVSPSHHSHSSIHSHSFTIPRATTMPSISSGTSSIGVIALS